MKLIQYSICFYVCSFTVLLAAPAAELSTELHEPRTSEENGRVRRQTLSRSSYEIIAQSACEGLLTNSNLGGWVYAVQRVCNSNQETCEHVCSSRVLHGQDSQTAHSTWSTLGAFHVYGSRPSSGASTRNSPHIGLKVYYNTGYFRSTGCGPNYCCCRAV